MDRRLQCALPILLAVATSGCVSTRQMAAPAQPFVPVFAAATAAPQEHLFQGIETLVLEVALARVRTANPVLAAARSGMNVAAAGLRQARLLPNPTVTAASEEIPINKFGNLGESVNTVSISQEIVTAGKRKAAMAVADTEVTLAFLEFDVLQREMLTDTKKAFYALLAGQERLAATARLVEIARRSATASQRRVDAGDAAPVDTVRAQLALSQALIGHRQARVEQSNASVVLQELMGYSYGILPPVGPRDALYELPPEASSEDSLLLALEQHPATDLLEAGVALTNAEVVQARSEQWPNVEIGFGHESAPGETAGREESYGMEISFPLPLFDRNQGAVDAAKSAFVQAKQERQAGRVQLATQLRQARHVYVAAREATENYRKQIVPGSRRVYDLVKRSYDAGEIDQLELLEAQQGLVEAELTYIDNLASLMEAQADLESLTLTVAGGSTTKENE